MRCAILRCNVPKNIKMTQVVNAAASTSFCWSKHVFLSLLARFRLSIGTTCCWRCGGKDVLILLKGARPTSVSIILFCNIFILSSFSSNRQHCCVLWYPTVFSFESMSGPLAHWMWYCVFDSKCVDEYCFGGSTPSSSALFFWLFVTKASRTGWLVVVCERSERLGGLGGSLDERAKFGSLSWCLGWVLGTFCRVTYQVANGWRWGIDSPPDYWAFWCVIIGGNRVDKRADSAYVRPRMACSFACYAQKEHAAFRSFWNRIAPRRDVCMDREIILETSIGL